MAHGVGKASSSPPKEKVQVLDHSVVIDSIRFREREVPYEVPKVVYREVAYEKPVVRSRFIDTTKYKVVEQPTTKFVVKERETVQFVPREVEFEKPIIKEKEYERPILKDREYIVPKVVYKEEEIVKAKDVEVIRSYTKAVEELTKTLPKLQEQLDKLRDTRVVERIVYADKIQYVTQKVQRIEWVPVKREVPEGMECPSG